MWHAGSLAVADVIYLPDQGLNPGPLHWECRVLATGPLREAPLPFILKSHVKFAFSSLIWPLTLFDGGHLLLSEMNASYFHSAS